MGFTLRFMLGLILVLATSSVFECASSWRHIRQAPPVEDLPEVPILHDGLSNLNESTTEENVNIKNAVNKTASDFSKTEKLLLTTGDEQKAPRNESLVEKKPKTETNTEKLTKDNKIYVNKTSSNSSNTNSKVDKKLESENVPSEGINKTSEGNLEKPVLSDSSVAEDVKKILIKKDSQKAVDEESVTTQKVPEIKQLDSAARAEGARSLDIDITKYVSPEFHNKNNVYSFSVSPDTEKYTNLHNELPKSTTSRLHAKETSKTIFGAEPTTPSNDDFDKKFQNIEEGVRQKLEYIDHQFPEIDHDFKKSHDDDTINIRKFLDEPKSNDTTVDLSYIIFKNISNNYNRGKTNVHKELDVESGQNIDYTSSYNKTQVFDEQPKDYKNKIPTHEEDVKPDILSELLPEHGETKTHKAIAVPADGSKELESEITNDKVPEITVKDTTSLTKPPSLNKTESHTSLLSNKIETEIPHAVENNMKVEWDFPYSSSTSTTQATTTQSESTSKRGQDEVTAYTSYAKDNVINVSKRGSTKYVDTVKTITTTETVFEKKSRPSITLTNKFDPLNKLALANKENKTVEHAVLENQVFPVQIPAPNKDSKDEKTINDTTEKFGTTENSVLPVKLYTISQTSSPLPTSTQKVSNLSIHNQAEVATITTESYNFTTLNILEGLTTQHENSSMNSYTTVNTDVPEQTTKFDLTTEMTTLQVEPAFTTALENLTTVAAANTVVSTVTPYTTTMATETFDLVSTLNSFTTTTYEIDTSGTTEDIDGSSRGSTILQTVSSGDVSSGITYQFGSEAEDYFNNNTTTSTYEENGSTFSRSEENSETDERFNNGRDLKTNSNETNFSSTGLDYQTIEENSNNLDHNIPSSTTARNLNYSTTEYHIWSNTTRTNGTVLGTTSDYRENIIIKQVEPSSTTFTTTAAGITTTTKRSEEASHELVSKHNLTDTDGEDEGSEGETEHEIDPDVVDLYPTPLKPRMIKPNTEAGTSETTPFIVPLNVSMLEMDSTDSTTLGGNSGLDGEAEGSGGPIAAIVISCIGAVCLIILALLLFIMRKRQKRFNYGQRCTPVSLDAYSVDNVSVYNSMRRKGAMRASKRSYGNPAFDDPSSTTHSLNFPALAKFANNTEGIASEFEEIPQVTAQTNELPEGCETKNRYANVIPLPETRVFLNVIDGYPNSDYINANYVTGPKSSRGYYIACQAPMQNTVDDFWRMVWEQQSKVILMLTHLFENGTEKCIDYLPPSEVLDCHRLFGDFQVTLKKREVKEKYVISSLQLKNMVSNSWREVTHLWYLGWPEKGVPLEANSLIAFLIEARSYIKAVLPAEINKETPNDQPNGSINSEQSPVIIHCSPGTGRTGTIIACDIAIREFELTRQVDIPKTVYRIRRDRASSVQTREQYGFIYKVISLYATKLTGGVLDSL